MVVSGDIFNTQTFPTPFGDWQQTSAPVPLELSASLIEFWEAKGHVAFGFEKLVPRGTVDLIFNLAGPQAMYGDGDRSGMRTFSRAWISGLFDKPLFVGPAYDAGIMGTHLVGVSIHPWAAYGLFGIEAHELSNAVVEAEDLFGPDVDRAWHQIGDATCTHGRYAAIMAFLRRCKSRLARPTPFSAIWAAKQTQHGAGAVQVQDLCDELSISRKHLGTLFKRTLGMTPKAYGRLSRFRACMDALQSGEPDTFSGLAIDLGFSDQAHFINDFSSFAGESPQRFLRNVSSDGESVLFEQVR